MKIKKNDMARVTELLDYMLSEEFEDNLQVQIMNDLGADIIPDELAANIHYYIRQYEVARENYIRSIATVLLAGGWE